MDQTPVVVVTGGTGALGHVVVGALLTNGWTVHVPWRTRADADALAAAVGTAASRLYLSEADVTDPAHVERFFAAVDERSGRLDALCNLAGGFAMGRVEEITPESWHEMIATNATSVFLCCRAAAPRLKAANKGSIVNVASAAALEARPGMSAYVAAKAAVVALTRALAVELAAHRITVNALAPTTIDTAANRKAMPKADRSGWIAPSVLATTIQWLLGDGAASVTGTIISLGRDSG